MADGFDVIVLGTGNAGMGAAGVVRAAGKSVAMVESWDVGGTCPLRGCVPKKVLVAAAQVLHQIDIAPTHHITVAKPVLDWEGLIGREQSFVEGVPDDFAKSLENRGIELLEGRARFAGPNSVRVGENVLEAGKIVIATGSKPRELKIPGAEHLITSDDILKERALPRSLIFIGGGVIALEFSHVFARAGCQVTILEALPRLLPHMDADAVTHVREATEKLGIEILTTVKVEALEKSGDTLEVHFKHDGESKSLAAASVANGAGRVADVEDLDLDAGGIEHQGPRIMVDEQLRSVSNPDVYVAGDALWSSPQLSPIATHEGRVAGENIVGGEGKTPEYIHVPAIVFTVPALASVGLTEDEAKARGLDFAVKSNDMSGWRSSMTHAETTVYAKTLIEEGSNAILGAHMVGHGAEEVIHLFAFAMKHGVGADEIASAVYAYPTFTSDIKFLV